MPNLFSNIICGVIASILGAFIFGLFTKFYLGWTSWPGLRISLRLVREFTRAGGLNFFSSRKDYINHKDHGTASEYLYTSKRSIVYVGFWLAHGIEVSNIIECLRVILESGRKISIVLLNPNSDAISACSKFLGIDVSEVKQRINQTKSKLCELQNNLSPTAKENFTLKYHNIPLSTSAFLLDSELGSGGRTLLDFKLYGFSREDGFGIEFRNQGLSLYDRVTKSYLEIERNSYNSVD